MRPSPNDIQQVGIVIVCLPLTTRRRHFSACLFTSSNSDICLLTGQGQADDDGNLRP